MLYVMANFQVSPHIALPHAAVLTLWGQLPSEALPISW